jgi:sortase (surface protein transpeptidase)
VTDSGSQAGAFFGLRPPVPLGRHAVGSGRRWSLARAWRGPWRLARRRAARRPLAAAAAMTGALACVIASAGLVLASHDGHPATPPGRTPFVAVPLEKAVPPQDGGGAQTVPAPVALIIPAIGVQTRLIRLGRTSSGTLQVPATTAVAGWYTGSPRPGALGAAVIAGHVDSVTGPGVFFRLRLLRPRDMIFVRRADQSLAAFRVVGIRLYAKSHFPTAAVYGPAPVAELRVVTCGGTFDYATRHYLGNVIVFAIAVPWHHSAAHSRHAAGIVAPVRRPQAA